MSVVFMGSPDIAVPFLNAIVECEQSVLVFTQPDRIRGRGNKKISTPVKQRAEELRLPVFDYPIKSKQSLEIISDFAPDLIVVVSFGQLLPKKILAVPRIAPINIHFSLLPRYRGATPVQGALLNGDTETGITLQFMERRLDAGDIIGMSRIAIHPEDNATALFRRLTDAGVALLKEQWTALTTGSFSRTPQNEGEATYTTLIKKSDLHIDFSPPAEVVIRRIRAYTEEPGIKAFFRQKPVFIERARRTEGSGAPGEIIAVTDSALAVACGKDAIAVTALKPAGKRSMNVKAFINGYRPQLGEVWE